MEEEEQIRISRLIEQTQAERGDAGCFAELYQILLSAVGRLGILRSFIGEEEYLSRMARLGDIALGLPDFHNDQVVTHSLEEINRLTSFNPPI